MFGKPATAVPRWARGLPCQTSASRRPSRPRTRSAMGKSVTRKPVPKMIVSTSRFSPAVVTIDRSRTSAMPSVTRSTFGFASDGR
jgi:hypothetical protein